MKGSMNFLLIGEADNHRIEVGDTIEIFDAYQREGLPIFLANKYLVNGRPQKHGISMSYTRKLSRIGPVKGKIVRLNRELEDLTITIATPDNDGKHHRH